MTLRPKSDKLTRLDKSLGYSRTESPFTLNYQWPLLAQRMQTAHEQPPAASNQKVAIVHGCIIP